MVDFMINHDSEPKQGRKYSAYKILRNVLGAPVVSAGLITALGGCASSDPNSQMVKSAAEKDATMIERLASTDKSARLVHPPLFRPGIRMNLYAFRARGGGVYDLSLDRISTGPEKGKLTAVTIIEENANDTRDYGVSFFSGQDKESGIGGPNNGADNWSITRSRDTGKVGLSFDQVFTDYVKHPVYDNQHSLTLSNIGRYSQIATTIIRNAGQHEAVREFPPS
jgi:hypothetical protein